MVEDTQFIGNTAENDIGGGVQIETSTFGPFERDLLQVTFRNVDFIGNVAANGSALTIFFATLHLDNVRVRDNEGFSTIFMFASLGSFNNAVFEGNFTGGAGALSAIVSTQLDFITNGSFTDNVGGFLGAAITLGDDDPDFAAEFGISSIGVVTDTSFSGNVADEGVGTAINCIPSFDEFVPPPTIGELDDLNLGAGQTIVGCDIDEDGRGRR